MSQKIIKMTKDFSREASLLTFSSPVKYTYNPLEYTWPLHRQFLKKFGTGQKKVLFLGMNPGPYGMAQTGVPFGEVSVVKDWMKLSGKVNKPDVEHPKRPIQGLDCPRSEVSGQRLWGLFQKKFKTADRFFKNHYVINYCPLIFMETSGKNITPDKLPLRKRKALYKLCDENLIATVEYYKPEHIIGVGKFAEKRALDVIGNKGFQISTVLHPSPASPIANRGWAPQAEAQLKEIGIW